MSSSPSKTPPSINSSSEISSVSPELGASSLEGLPMTAIFASSSAERAVSPESNVSLDESRSEKFGKSKSASCAASSDSISDETVRGGFFTHTP